jgi:hypothetical protein
MTTAIAIAMIIGLCQSMSKYIAHGFGPYQFPNLISYLFLYDIADE